MNEKACIKCQTSYTEDKFRQGHNQCRECEAESCRLWRKNNPDKHKAAVESWKAANPDKVRELRNRWKENNPEKEAANHRNYYRNNRNKVCERRKQDRRANPIKYLLQKAKERAIKKGIEFNLTEADIAIPSVCPVLGIPLIVGDKIWTDNSPTIDRIDSTKGYVKGNVAVVSWRANALKKDGTLIELEKVVEYMRNGLKKND